MNGNSVHAGGMHCFTVYGRVYWTRTHGRCVLDHCIWAPWDGRCIKGSFT